MSALEWESPYPDYDVLSKWDSPSWNETTRRVVRARLEQVPERRFLTLLEWQTLEAVCARLLPQPERQTPIPIVPWIDAKLHDDRTDGYRYEDLPPQREAYRRALAGLDRESERLFGAPFGAISEEQQDSVLRNLQRGAVFAEPFQGMSATRLFNQVLGDALSVYYAHPAAWSEIGFGGPASPRGYVRLTLNRRDPWEAEERALQVRR